MGLAALTFYRDASLISKRDSGIETNLFSSSLSLIYLGLESTRVSVCVSAHWPVRYVCMYVAFSLRVCRKQMQEHYI